jgi:hypothetical protein
MMDNFPVAFCQWEFEIVRCRHVQVMWPNGQAQITIDFHVLREELASLDLCIRGRY